MEYVLKKTETGKKITVRMLQNKLLEMMKDIDKICQKNAFSNCERADCHI